jgi:hypothetical protein
MTITRTFCVLSLVFCTFFAQAQLSKGTMTVGAGGGINVSFTKASQDGFFSKFNNGSLNISPSVGYFVNSRWLLGSGVRLGVYQSKQSENFPQPNPQVDLTTRSFNFNVSPFVRYYLKNAEKTGIFLYANTLYSGGWTRRINKINSAASSSSYNDNFNWSAGIGMQRMINPQIAVEGSLGYSDNKNIYMGIGLRNFVTMNDKSEAVAAYITKGRLLVDGSIGLSYFTPNSSLSFSYYSFIGKMVSDKFMIGGGSSYSTGGGTYWFSLSPQVRYYIPITNRLLVYPYIGGRLNAEKQNEKTSSLSFDRGIGYNYFLTKYVALSGEINGNLNSNNQNNAKIRTGNVSINVGITQFIQ